MQYKTLIKRILISFQNSLVSWMAIFSCNLTEYYVEIIFNLTNILMEIIFRGIFRDFLKTHFRTDFYVEFKTF